MRVMQIYSYKTMQDTYIYECTINEIQFYVSISYFKEKQLQYYFFLLINTYVPWIYKHSYAFAYRILS